jgi:hypothetical protein
MMLYSIVSLLLTPTKKEIIFSFVFFLSFTSYPEDLFRRVVVFSLNPTPLSTMLSHSAYT